MDIQHIINRWWDYRDVRELGGEDAVEHEFESAVPTAERRLAAREALDRAYPMFVSTGANGECPNCTLPPGDCICPDVRWVYAAPSSDLLEAAAAAGVGLAWFVTTREVIAVGLDRVATYAVAAYAVRRRGTVLHARGGIVVYTERIFPDRDGLLGEALRLAPQQVRLTNARLGLS